MTLSSECADDDGSDELPQEYIDEAREALMNPEPQWPLGYRFDLAFRRPISSGGSSNRSARSTSFVLTEADREFLTFAASVIVNRVRRGFGLAIQSEIT